MAKSEDLAPFLGDSTGTRMIDDKAGSSSLGPGPAGQCDENISDKVASGGTPQDLFRLAQ